MLGEMRGVKLYDHMICFAPTGSNTRGHGMRTSSVAEVTEVCGRRKGRRMYWE